MDMSGLRIGILKYARDPITPSSAGLLAIINGVFAPFAYVPSSGFPFLPYFEPVSLVNRGSGIVVVALSVVAFGLLIKKRPSGTVIVAGLAFLIVLAEAYWVTVMGVTGRQTSSLDDPTGLFTRGPSIVYNLTVRARLGSGFGYLLGGYISLFFAVHMARRSVIRTDHPAQNTVKSRPTTILTIGLLLLVLLTAVYSFLTVRGKPIIRSHIVGFSDGR